MKKFILVAIVVGVLLIVGYQNRNNDLDSYKSKIIEVRNDLSESIVNAKDDVEFFVNEGGIESTVYDVKKKIRKMKKELSGN